MKPNCIIDTNSMIYLNNASSGRMHLLKELKNCVSLKFCNEVHLEIVDHYYDGMPGFLSRLRHVDSPKRFKMDEYERKMLGNVLPSRERKGNKGEINSFLLAVDKIHHLKITPIILITDDLKALNGHMNSWLRAFPSIKIWSSFDVILFLYAERILGSISYAEESLRLLISTMNPRKKMNFEPTPEDEEVMELHRRRITLKLQEYRKLLSHIQQIIE